MLNATARLQRYTGRNQRINFLYILVFSGIVIFFIGRSQFQSTLNQSDGSIGSPLNGLKGSLSRRLINFDGIKIDQNILIQEKIKSYKLSFPANQKNKSWQQEIQKFLTRVSPYFQNRSICADNWAIIVEFSENVLETAKRLPNWCIVLVFEQLENPPNLPENIFVLNDTVQYELGKISTFYKESLQLPRDLYAVRKNLGYLWAIFHQAIMIWDFDSVNELIVNQSVLSYSQNETIEVLTVPNHNKTVFNPYAFFVTKFDQICTRGYPYRVMKNSSTTNTVVQTLHGILPIKNLAVINSLIEGYADVWGKYYLVKPDLPLQFKNFSNDNNKDLKLIVPRRTFSPYDQQATLYFQPALWALFMPVTVHQQVTDIYRSYIMQRLMWDVGLQIAFVGSFLTKRYIDPEAQETNLLFRKSEATRQVEKVLFWEIDNLIQFLTQWLSKQTNFIEHAEELFIALHENGYMKIIDVYLLEIWLQELYQIGYIFPAIGS